MSTEKNIKTAEKNITLSQWADEERPIPIRKADEDYAAFFRRILNEWSYAAKEAELAHRRWCERLQMVGGVQSKDCRHRIFVVLRELFDSAFLKDDYIDTGMPREDCDLAVRELKRLGYDELCLMEGADWKFALLSRFLLREDVDYVMVDEMKAGYYINNVREEISESAAEAFCRFATFARLVHGLMGAPMQMESGADDFERYKNILLTDIKPLRSHVNTSFKKNFEKMIEQILLVDNLLEKLKKEAPHKFPGGYNQKLICNIVGLLCSEEVFDLNPRKADHLIYTDKTHYTYINNYTANDGNIGLNAENIEDIRDIINSFA